MSYQEMKTNGEIYSKFLTIIPKSQTYLKYNLEPISLNVIQTDGVDYTPDVNIKVNDLNEGKKYFLNNSGEGDSFKIKIIIKKDEFFRGYIDTTNPNEDFDFIHSASSRDGIFHASKKLNLLTALNYWIKKMPVFIVTTRALDIPNGEYIITANPNRKQTYEDSTVWELVFTKYTGVTTIRFKSVTNSADKAVKQYNQAKELRPLKLKLKKCNYKHLVYSKKKKVLGCVKVMQQYLYKKKFLKKKQINGWYDKNTVTAVKNYQKKYSKSHNLKVSGKIDKKTFDVMTKV